MQALTELYVVRYKLYVYCAGDERRIENWKHPKFKVKNVQQITYNL